ncbi:ParA family protein [Parashewanella spongiae]|uniref:ParA family protein n=1 Tax=Parashewanella spongiae TaxID=342950 RepID=A0A3A6TNF0_9GAMM|nr:AAA family ATPase [Parashewanella spongiae]MCL1078718.1 AAA family ATPase [Parashewanella spongiae]RJY12289.1 ParA family protein [Parashewanella spongiae]
MKIVSVINYKGGVGKTTVTSNIAAQLAYTGYRVLLLDMDAQASLTFSLEKPEFWDENLRQDKTIKSWFDRISESEEVMPLHELVHTPSKANSRLPKGSNGCLDLISSHLGLINVDLELATLLGGANLKQSKVNYIKVHGKLKNALVELGERNNYDIVLVDCPPNFNIVTKNAIVASDQILIPAKPDYLSTLGIEYLQRSMNELIQEFNEFGSMDESFEKVNPEILGVVFTMIQIRNQQPIAAQRQFIAQTKRLKVPVFESNFRENKTIFADAPQECIPVVLNGYTNQTYSGIVEELEDLVTEFISRSGVINE